MKNILIIGAGRSSGALIDYLIKNAVTHNWNIVVADANVENAKLKIGGANCATAVAMDVKDASQRKEYIRQADVVVSLLPASLHQLVAIDCLSLKKHLLTASYVSESLEALHDEVKANNLIFMGELGLDPGIDHMSAMQLFAHIRNRGGQITGFRSYTGGLVAPQSDTNPWHYKVSWNPANVVRAGQGTAQYLHYGQYKYIPYNRLFKEHQVVDIHQLGPYEVYANRDSLLYESLYGLEGVQELIRGTIRHLGFCDAWHALIQLGLTDDTFNVVHGANATYRELVEAYLPQATKDLSLTERLADYLKIPVSSPILKQLEWLGLLSEKPIGMAQTTPAQILQALIEEKWVLQPHDQDRVIMQHECDYSLNGLAYRQVSTLIYDGINATDTAMARLVGLPLGIVTRLVMEGNITERGVLRPLHEEVYNPVMEELKVYHVAFDEANYLLSPS